jgi:tetratricopeptide (TPR) repeat protein
MAKSTQLTAARRTAEASESRGGFLLGNTRLLGIIGLVLLAAIGGVFWFYSQRAKDNERAQMALARIRPYYERGEFATAIKGDPAVKRGNESVVGLTSIVGEWKSTSAGKIAALYLGNCYLATNENAKAKDAFEVATGADDELIQAGAHAGIASIAEAAGQYAQAADEYAKAISEDRHEVNTPFYLLGAARNLERAGKKEEAIKNYRTVATQYATSQANTEARLALARNNVVL